MKEKLMYRQGDVLLVLEDEVPKAAEELKPEGDRIVLAYGEVTGHAHAVGKFSARIHALGETRFLEVGENGADLVHEEHAAICLKPGVYRIVHQREYVPDGSRLVYD